MSNEAAAWVDGDYRYWLTRRWGEGPLWPVVMLNPSTADAAVDDPTIRRCQAFARREGRGGIAVLNLYAYRATDPRELTRTVDPVGPFNDAMLSVMFRVATGPVLVAWGARALPDRVERLRSLAGDAALVCLGKTKAGHPRHPLYVEGSTELEEWR
jgi:hypothetical protein